MHYCPIMLCPSNKSKSIANWKTGLLTAVMYPCVQIKDKEQDASHTHRFGDVISNMSPNLN